jgi:hypothetical protein
MAAFSFNGTTDADRVFFPESQFQRQVTVKADAPFMTEVTPMLETAIRTAAEGVEGLDAGQCLSKLLYNNYIAFSNVSRANLFTTTATIDVDGSTVYATPVRVSAATLLKYPSATLVQMTGVMQDYAAGAKYPAGISMLITMLVVVVDETPEFTFKIGKRVVVAGNAGKAPPKELSPPKAKAAARKAKAETKPESVAA